MKLPILALFCAVAYLAPVTRSEAPHDSSDAQPGPAEKLLFDFATADQAALFRPINDGVMGGISEGRMKATAESTAVFWGILSLENNGGFSSVRTVPQKFQLGAFTGVQIRVRGDGRTYKFRIRTDANLDGVAWQADFATTRDEWLEVDLPFTAFAASFRGRPVPDAPALDPDAIQQLGFMIADKTAGPFRLEVGWIKAVVRGL